MKFQVRLNNPIIENLNPSTVEIVKDLTPAQPSAHVDVHRPLRARAVPKESSR